LPHSEGSSTVARLNVLDVRERGSIKILQHRGDFLTPILLDERASVSLYADHAQTVECPEVRLSKGQCPITADKTVDLEREEPIDLLEIRKRGEEHKALFLRADPVLLLMKGGVGVIVKEECGNFILDLDCSERWRQGLGQHIDILSNITNFVAPTHRCGWLNYARFSDVDGNSGRSMENSRVG
jgi:hypothetical protein